MALNILLMAACLLADHSTVAEQFQKEGQAQESFSGQAGQTLLGSGAFSISPLETPSTSPILSPIGSPRGDSGESTSFQAPVGETIAFDMFQVSKSALVQFLPSHLQALYSQTLLSGCSISVYFALSDWLVATPEVYMRIVLRSR